MGIKGTTAKREEMYNFLKLITKLMIEKILAEGHFNCKHKRPL
jgi:hypothetical protein